jgi:hypothetical protein
MPRDDSSDLVNAAFGSPPPDCSTALDLTWPVWILMGVGALTLFIGFCVWYEARTPQEAVDEEK